MKTAVLKSMKPATLDLDGSCEDKLGAGPPLAAPLSSSSLPQPKVTSRHTSVTAELDIGCAPGLPCSAVSPVRCGAERLQPCAGKSSSVSSTYGVSTEKIAWMTAPTHTPESVLSGATASLNLLRVASEKPAKYLASHKAQARPRKASTRSCVFRASQIREHSELQKREQHGCAVIVPVK